MPTTMKGKRGQPDHKHAYLTGNFAPINQTASLTPCTFEGTIPEELAGGEYIRNGGNPVSNEDLGRDAHWFDGDGMLSGVSFRRDHKGRITPEFVNQYVLTDVYLSSRSSKHVKTPILPSIATLVNPAASLVTITLRIFRTILLVILSFLPGSRQAIKKISVANTSIYYHDGRALAGCESGPPMRISLPGLETVGWYDGNRAEGEPAEDKKDEKLGGEGLLGWIREWTTAHPKVDPQTKEMMLFHSSFAPPYVQYSVIPEAGSIPTSAEKLELTPHKKLLNMPVPGVASAKMMHDFGVSPTHSVIMDLPLSLDPLNLAKGRPVVEYDAMKPSRFGVFPRHQPDLVRWFETAACCIFHTANTWDEVDQSGAIKSVHMLACRLTSSSLVFSAGNVAAPQPTARTVKKVKQTMPFFAKYNPDCLSPRSPIRQGESYFDLVASDNLDDLEGATPLTYDRMVRLNSQEDEEPLLMQEDELEDFTDAEEDQCRLYHYNFSLSTGDIISQYALSAIAFEFPSVHPDREMQAARYIYGCSTSASSFGAALGRSVKIDVLVKADVHDLIGRGERLVAQGMIEPVTGCVDRRSLSEIVQSNDQHDPIKVMVMPQGWFAQEPRFVPRHNAQSEDDGYLLFYAFDESQLDAEGEVPCDVDSHLRAKSELWIVDAKDMQTLIGKVKLPQRVPYGLHGTWFPENQVQGQRAVESVRTTAKALKGSKVEEEGLWMTVRSGLEKWLA